MAMGTKRQFTDFVSPDAEQGHTHSQSPDIPGPSAKRFKRDGKGKHKAKEGSIEWAKKRVRAVERLFQRDNDLPANVRNDLERELAAHRATIADRAFQKKRSLMISKYHMVRFFERKKAMRLAKQLRRKIELCTDTEEREQLQRDLHVAEVDEAYALNFPHAEPYISLYGNSKSDDAEEDAGAQTPAARAALKSERPPMWSTIEETMPGGPDALRKLRERKQSTGEPTAKAPRHHNGPPPKTTAHPQTIAKQREQPTTKTAGGEKHANQMQMNRRERRRLMHKGRSDANKAEEDDGEGFFEEG